MGRVAMPRQGLRSQQTRQSTVAPAIQLRSTPRSSRRQARLRRVYEQACQMAPATQGVEESPPPPPADISAALDAPDSGELSRVNRQDSSVVRQGLYHESLDQLLSTNCLAEEHAGKYRGAKHMPRSARIQCTHDRKRPDRCIACAKEQLLKGGRLPKGICIHMKRRYLASGRADMA